MTPSELAAALADPAQPLVHDALRRLPPPTLHDLSQEIARAAAQGWQDLVVDRVEAFLAEQPEDAAPVMAAYFTPTERRAADQLAWSPFIAALSPTEDIADLRATRTTVRAAAVGEAEKAVEQLADEQLTEALDWLAALDPPGYTDVLRVHLPTRTVARVSLNS
ncbi:hypothetical protein [Streptomyces minutiscleroticus]|uniref:hypothetical protein n=1 Tax=Streptomyces minutiscleroticus TaxID=68238 RepID=UPI003327E402